MTESLSSLDISPKLERIAKQAKEIRGAIQTLAHYIDVNWLRGLPPHAEGWRTRGRRTERGIVRGAAGAQPPVAPRPREDRAIPGAAGATGAHPEG
jgi:hypothetical protein